MLYLNIVNEHRKGGCKAMENRTQISESLGLGALLAISGGAMDAYSYIFRGEVFANAQTGNMLLLGVHLAQGEWAQALSYFCPVLFFSVGIIISILIRSKPGREQALHWRQAAVLFEAAVLAGVCFIPRSADLIANSLISLACGIQLESFTKIRGSAVATTMCIGNLRLATENLCAYIGRRDRAALKKTALYFGIILFFVLGAVMGNFALRVMGQYALMLCTVILLTVFILMFFESRGGKNGNK